MTALAWLATRLLGPRCARCGDRCRGWRTLAAHMWLQHGDEVA